ncbi:MAG: 30S ribosomal protein S12 methylthiotransferase RimO [Candidatus Omnitrophota bacterium]
MSKSKNGRKKIYLLSLGCSRNMVDSEVLGALLEKKGYDILDEPHGADVAVINTCGFIQDAKQESIDLILQLADLKKQGSIKKLIVCGCLAQRFPSAIADQIKEIDGIFGTSDFTLIPDKIDAIFHGDKIHKVTRKPQLLCDHQFKRKTLTPPHYAYVKIQEGCSNKCAYCVIPDLRGPLRSRTVKSVLAEVKRLKDERDLKELVLTGQDTTAFGLERSGSERISGLLRKLSPLMKDAWIRLLYTHPAHFTDELLDVMADTEVVCKYIDLPIQHCNNRILRKMNRCVTKEEIVKLIAKLRKKIPDVTIRTSVIVGFPGETDEEFGELLGFLEETRFDRLGAFIYSREEGTPAAGFKGQLPEKVKRERFDRVMTLQQGISSENNRTYLNKRLKTLIDEEDSSRSGWFIGRAQMDAPEVDGNIHVHGSGLAAGEFVEVLVTGTSEYDLVGEAV